MANSKAFYAYAGHKEDLKEDIRDAVKAINESGNNIVISTWEDYSIGGKFIIDDILSSIEHCDLFMCDLTYINFNVLYELGYAIAKEKKIWISLNKTHSDSVLNYKNFKPLTTIGYAGYSNSYELENSFYSELPHVSGKKIEIGNKQNELIDSLVYLKSEASTSASNIATSLINKSPLPKKVDDKLEITAPLNWYLENLQNSLGVIIHFHTTKSDQETSFDVGRKALVAGLAKGLGCNTLLLAHSPFQAPLDYDHELNIHSTADDCEMILKKWLEPLHEEFKEKVEDYKGYEAGKKALGKLSNLIIGDYVAENESGNLLDYFLETAEYKEALNSQKILFVGRKGTGKTANLIKLKNQFALNKRNFVVSIQPQGHEFEGILDILDKLSQSSEEGHLIESIWKYLIYSEIAKQYFDYLDSLPLHYTMSEDETEFCDFVQINERFINADFTLRLENIINNLKTIEETDTLEQQRYKVSEFLHNTMINHLRKLLGKVLHKKENVKILVDNLDKSWNDNAELNKLSTLLFGLLNVIHRITDEFEKTNYNYINVNLSLIVFLRSDIFSRVMLNVQERDKIATKYLKWTDSNLLFRVIEERINYSSEGVSSPEALWNNYFCPHVRGMPIREYIINLIIPRPRDIIFLFKAALQKAINHGHTRVEEEDFIDAEYLYSEYAIFSLFPENGNRINDLEELLYEFAGSSSIISQEELEQYLNKISKSMNVNELVKVLCEMTFVGQEIQDGQFEYYGYKRPDKLIDKLAEKLSEQNGCSKRYKINPAFHAYLDITN